MVTVIKCSTDKPWVTPSFHNLVKSRQRAFFCWQSSFLSSSKKPHSTHGQ